MPKKKNLPTKEWIAEYSTGIAKRCEAIVADWDIQKLTKKLTGLDCILSTSFIPTINRMVRRRESRKWDNLSIENLIGFLSDYNDQLYRYRHLKRKIPIPPEVKDAFLLLDKFGKESGGASFVAMLPHKYGWGKSLEPEEFNKLDEIVLENANRHDNNPLYFRMIEEWKGMLAVPLDIIQSVQSFGSRRYKNEWPTLLSFFKVLHKDKATKVEIQAAGEQLVKYFEAAVDEFTELIVFTPEITLATANGAPHVPIARETTKAPPKQVTTVSLQEEFDAAPSVKQSKSTTIEAESNLYQGTAAPVTRLKELETERELRSDSQVDWGDIMDKIIATPGLKETVEEIIDNLNSGATLIDTGPLPPYDE